jgi:hypothetical protein
VYSSERFPSSEGVPDVRYSSLGAAVTDYLPPIIATKPPDYIAAAHIPTYELGNSGGSVFPPPAGTSAFRNPAFPVGRRSSAYSGGGRKRKTKY